MAAKGQDFGPCASCGVNNSHLVSKCRDCGAMLPWAKPAKGKAASAATPPQPQAMGRPTGPPPMAPGAPGSSFVTPGGAPARPGYGPPPGSLPSVGGAWKPGQVEQPGTSAAALWGIGLLAFVFPCIGFYMYRNYSDSIDNEDKAAPALIGAVLGVVLGVASRLAYMSSR